jgi:hypothetical protein
MKKTATWLAVLLAAAQLIACRVGPPPQDPHGVWEAFLKAMNAHDLDTAMSFVADDAVFDTVYGDAAGEQEIRAFLASFFDQDAHTVLQDVRVAGSVVSATEQVTSAEGELLFTLEGEVIVEGGKIKSYHLFYPCNPILEDCE